MIDHRADNFVEHFAEFFLVDVMLVQSHADCLRVDFYQFRKRVLQPPPHADSAADCQIQIGEFLARNIACRIHGRAAFIDNRVAHVLVVFADDLAHNRLHFLTASTVSDCNNLNVVFIDSLVDFVIRAVRVCNLLNKKTAEIFACFVERGAFCARANAGVNAEYAAAFYRLRHQKVL